MSMDTLALHRRLTEAGAEPKLAEAISTGIRDAVDGHAASKADLREAVAMQKSGLREAVAKLEAAQDRLLVKIGLMFGAGLTLLFLALEYASR